MVVRMGLMATTVHTVTRVTTCFGRACSPHGYFETHPGTGTWAAAGATTAAVLAALFAPAVQRLLARRDEDRARLTVSTTSRPALRAMVHYRPPNRHEGLELDAVVLRPKAAFIGSAHCEAEQKSLRHLSIPLSANRQDEVEASFYIYLDEAVGRTPRIRLRVVSTATRKTLIERKLTVTAAVDR